MNYLFYHNHFTSYSMYLRSNHITFDWTYYFLRYSYFSMIYTLFLKFNYVETLFFRPRHCSTRKKYFSMSGFLNCQLRILLREQTCFGVKCLLCFVPKRSNYSVKTIIWQRRHISLLLHCTILDYKESFHTPCVVVNYQKYLYVPI